MIRMIQPLANMSKATRWLAPLAKALFPARLGPDQHVTSMWPKHGRSTQVENRDTAHWHNPIPLGMVEVLSSMGYCHITHYRNSFINSMIGTHSISQMWLKSELLCAKATVYSPLVFITRCGRLRCFSFVQTNDNDKRIDLLFPKHIPSSKSLPLVSIIRPTNGESQTNLAYLTSKFLVRLVNATCYPPPPINLNRFHPPESTRSTRWVRPELPFRPAGVFRRFSPGCEDSFSRCCWEGAVSPKMYEHTCFIFKMIF